MNSNAWILRPARAEDAEGIARLFIETRKANMAYLNWDYDHSEILALFRDQVLPRQAVWVAEAEGVLAGFLALEGEELDRLYVLPELQGRGAGKALLAKAKALSPAGLWLWVFQQNQRARDFYERQGFELHALTDGQENMEKVPDARYRWQGN